MSQYATEQKEFDVDDIKVTLKYSSLWSHIERSDSTQFWKKKTPEQQIRSRTCPSEGVGKSIKILETKTIHT